MLLATDAVSCAMPRQQPAIAGHRDRGGVVPCTKGQRRLQQQTSVCDCLTLNMSDRLASTCFPWAGDVSQALNVSLAPCHNFALPNFALQPTTDWQRSAAWYSGRHGLNR
jgi:hypothetical protein